MAAPVVIETGAFLGANVTVLPGVTDRGPVVRGRGQRRHRRRARRTPWWAGCRPARCAPCARRGRRAREPVRPPRGPRGRAGRRRGLPPVPAGRGLRGQPVLPGPGPLLPPAPAPGPRRPARRARCACGTPSSTRACPSRCPPSAIPVDLLQLVRPDEAGISLVLALHVPLAAVAFYALARRLLGAPPRGGRREERSSTPSAASCSPPSTSTCTSRPPPGLPWSSWPWPGSGSPAPAEPVAAAALAVAVALSTTGVEIVAQAVVVGSRPGAVAAKGRMRHLPWPGSGAPSPWAPWSRPRSSLLVASQVGSSARGQGFETNVVLAHSVHPFTLLQGLVAGLYGNLSNLANEWWGQNFFPRGFPYILSLYVGPAALGLALVGARGRHPLRAPLVLLALLGLVLCLGRWAGLAPAVEALRGMAGSPLPGQGLLHRAPGGRAPGVAGPGPLRRGGEPPRVDAPRGRRRRLSERSWRWRRSCPGLIPGTMARFAAAFFPPGVGARRPRGAPLPRPGRRGRRGRGGPGGRRGRRPGPGGTTPARHPAGGGPGRRRSAAGGLGAEPHGHRVVLSSPRGSSAAALDGYRQGGGSSPAASTRARATAPHGWPGARTTRRGPSPWPSRR